MYYEHETEAPLLVPTMNAGHWYLKGFADAYYHRPAMIPKGPAGESYRKGYDEGLKAAWRESRLARPSKP